MKIRIFGDQQELTAEARAVIERRLLFALSRFGPKTKRVTVEFADERPPLGGAATSCKITVRLQRSSEVSVTVVDAELETAVARAAERVGRAVARSIDRRREFEQPQPYSIR